MTKKETNYINLIYEIRGAGNNNDEIMNILYRYDIHDIKTFQHRVLEYIFLIEEYEIKFKLFNVILEANILPVVCEVSSMDSVVLEKKYLINDVKKEIDYMGLIHKLENTEKDNVEELNKVLHRYDLHDIKIIQHRILQYILSIKESKIRYKLFVVILKFSNLPILYEYYNISGFEIYKNKSVLSRIRKDVSHINLIFDLKEAGRNNKEKMPLILYRYDIANIDVLQSRVLNYIMSIEEYEIRTMFIDFILDSNSIPIMHECHKIINCNISQENYIKKSSKDCLRLRYKFCMMIFEQSSVFKEKQKTLVSKDEIPNSNRTRVLSHKGRNRITAVLY